MPASFPELYKADVLRAIETIELEKVGQAIDILIQAREADRRIFVCGNGGSASTASHFVCDMVKGASFRRDKRFRIMALTDSLPTITAYANDVSYDCVFVEQLKNFAEPGDVVMAISGSGNSPNVLQAVEYANSIGCRTIALSGRNGGKLGPMAQLNLQASNPAHGPHRGCAHDCHAHDLLLLHGRGETGLRREHEAPLSAGEAQGQDRRHVWYGLLSVALAAVLLYYCAARAWNGRSVWTTITHARWQFLVAACLTTCCSFFMRSYRWRILLNTDAYFDVPTVFVATMAGYLGNSFLPARAGEFVRTYIISSRSVTEQDLRADDGPERAHDGCDRTGFRELCGAAGRPSEARLAGRCQPHYGRDRRRGFADHRDCAAHRGPGGEVAPPHPHARRTAPSPAGTVRSDTARSEDVSQYQTAGGLWLSGR